MWIRHDHPDDGGSTHPESSINSNETTRCYIPEESKPQLLNYHPQGRRRHGRPLKRRECWDRNRPPWPKFVMVYVDDDI